jgi:hypothetical protein
MFVDIPGIGNEVFKRLLRPRVDLVLLWLFHLSNPLEPRLNPSS